jgi:transposase-like protein
MTEYSDEFKARFRPAYGRYGHARPDFARCADTVSSGSVWHGSKQCSRKNGHGPDGAFCKQHDPQAIAAKRVALDAAWKRKSDQQARDIAFALQSKDAIRAIAEGHNDPMTLAREILARYEGKA